MEKVIGVFLHVVYLIIYTFIFFYFLKNRRTYSFVRGFFITACSFAVIGELLLIFVHRLDIRALIRLFGWDGSLGFISTYFIWTGSFLVVYGISFLIGNEYSREGIKTELPAMKGERRNIGISLLLFVVTLGIYFPFWLYRTVKDLRDNFEREIPYTPGKAAGFLFIPIFNIYWVFYILFSLPLRIKQIEKNHFGKNVGFYFHPVLIPILTIAFSLLSNLRGANLPTVSSFREMNVGEILYFWSGLLAFWLTIQAKLNAFFDSQKSSL
jgi:hypothetical protein